RRHTRSKRDWSSDVCSSDLRTKPCLTIAVLGSGFFHIYPKPHLALCKEIAKHGLVLSEYPPYKRPQKYFFPERNRIISGLSQARSEERRVGKECRKLRWWRS